DRLETLLCHDHCSLLSFVSCLFFFHDPPSPEIYTLSLHDALPIFWASATQVDAALKSIVTAGDSLGRQAAIAEAAARRAVPIDLDRKSTRLNSSHLGISYAVFCLKKKKKNNKNN